MARSLGKVLEIVGDFVDLGGLHLDLQGRVQMVLVLTLY
jgi:hypothetical protein